MNEIPLLPANLGFEEVHQAAGEAVNPVYLRRKLKRLGAIRRIGADRSLVSSQVLEQREPELYQAVLRRRMLG